MNYKKTIIRLEILVYKCCVHMVGEHVNLVANWAVPHIREDGISSEISDKQV